jgi:hypothetical protein
MNPMIQSRVARFLLPSAHVSVTFLRKSLNRLEVESLSDENELAFKTGQIYPLE